MSTQRAFPRVEVEQITVVGPDRNEAIGEEFVEETIQSLGEREELIYELNIDSVFEPGSKMTGRAYVRVKNPLEPDIIDVRSSNLISDDGLFNSYNVTVAVSK